MEAFYDYRKFAVLYVDDEEKSLKYFSRAFGDVFRIYTAPSVAAGEKVLEEHGDEIAVLLTDQRMPEKTGVELLEKLRRARPRIIRLLVTAFADLDSAIEAVNSGAIYKYITKPWDISELEATLRRAMEFFLVERERDALLNDKLSRVQDLLVLDRILSLAVAAAAVNRKLRRTGSAIQALMDLIPDFGGMEAGDRQVLRHPDFWTECQERIRGGMDRFEASLAASAAVDSGATGLDFGALFKSVRDRLSGASGLMAGWEVAGLDTLEGAQGDAESVTCAFEALLYFGLAASGEQGDLRVQGRPSADGDFLCVAFHFPAGCDPSQQLGRFLLRPSRTDLPGDPFLALGSGLFLLYHLGGTLTAPDPQSWEICLPRVPPPPESTGDDQAFLARVLLNEALWERLMGAAR